MTNRGFLVAKDFFPFFSTRNMARVAYVLFRRQARGAVTVTDLAAIIRMHQADRQRLMQAMYSRDSIGKTAEGILDVAYVVIMFFVIIFGVYGVPFEQFWLFSTVLLSFAFVFGNSLRSIWDSLVIPFVVRPYDAGDIVKLATNLIPVRLIVDQINLLTTDFYGFDGRRWTLRNTAVLDAGVEQHTKSRNFYTEMYFHFENTLTAEQLEAFRARVQDWLANDDAPWDLDDYALFVERISPASETIVAFWVGLKSISWRGYFMYKAPLSNLILFCREVAADLGITFFIPKRYLYGVGLDAPVPPGTETASSAPRPPILELGEGAVDGPARLG